MEATDYQSTKSVLTKSVTMILVVHNLNDGQDYHSKYYAKRQKYPLKIQNLKSSIIDKEFSQI